jgi:hypothetical protein
LVADITQNGAESGAALMELEIRETLVNAGGQTGEFRFIARDNGKGMSAADLDRAVDPFVTDGVKHPGRRVGLGIPFLIQTALQSGGGWKIRSARAGEPAAVRGSEPAGAGEEAVGAGGAVCGTTTEAWFDLANVDTPPLGDIPGLFRSVLLFEGPGEIVLKRSRTGGGAANPNGRKAGGGFPSLDYEVRKTELEEALDGLRDASSLVLLSKYLRSLEGGEDA